MTQFFNRPKEKEKRRQLRKNTPQAEAIVWSKLRNKQILGHKFRRQYSVGPYIIDFYCPAIKLAVEIDGDSHFRAGAKDNDHHRAAFIESFGVRFLRFTNEEVYENLEGILAAIAQAIEKASEETGEIPSVSGTGMEGG